MQKLVFVNGAGNEIDLTSGNFGITNWEGLANTDLNIQTQQVPFEDGGVFLDALLEQREISVTVAIQDKNDLELRYQLKRELISALNPKLGEGVLTYTNDYLSKQIKAVPQIPIFENKNSNDAGTLKASVVFSCCSPYWEDVEEKSLMLFLGGSQIINNEGDIPCQLKIEIFPQGNVVNPQIKNITTKKNIMFENTLSKNLVINTNMGEKTVYEEEMKLKLNQYLSDITQIIFIEKNLSYYALSNRIILYSLNGENWEFIDTEAQEDLTSFVYNDYLDLFIAVGKNGYMMKSSDGINWDDNIDSTVSENIIGIAYSKQEHIFIATTRYDVIKSDNGVNWISIDIGNTGENGSVQYIENLNQFFIFDRTDNLYTSTNGTAWTITSNVGVYDGVGSICYSESLGYYRGSHDNYICKSIDGYSWTEDYIGISFRKLIYCSFLGLFITATTNGIYISEDGNSFNQVTNVPDIIYLYVIEVPNIEKIFVSGINGTVLSSYNAEDWKICQGGKTDTLRNLSSVAYSEKLNLFVAVGSYQALLTSKNGVNWNYKTNNVYVEDIIWIKELEMFMGVSTTYISKSYDGINWSSIDLGQVRGYKLHSIVYSAQKHLFVAVGGSGPVGDMPCIISSSDGINWTSRISGATSTLRKVVYCKYLGKFIACGDREILISNDGINWTTVLSNTSNRDIAISEQLKQIVVVGFTEIIISKDANNWQTVRNGRFTTVAYSESYNMFLCGCNDRTILLFSNDGINWNNINISNFISDIVYGLNKFILIGGYEIVYQLAYESEEVENKINEISTDSDMNLNLIKGNNEIQIARESGSFNCRISYRQKYIGV